MPKLKTKFFFATYRESKNCLSALIKRNNQFKDTHSIYDLKKTHPKRKKTRYLVGSYFDWLNL